MRRCDPGAGSRPTGVAAHRFGGRGRRDERGALTAEASLVIPSLVLVTLLLVWMISLVAVRLHVIDASREAARLLARGEPVAQARAVAHQIAGPEAVVAVQVEEHEVRVRVEAPGFGQRPGGVLGAILAPVADLRVGADAIAAREEVR